MDKNDRKKIVDFFFGIKGNLDGKSIKEQREYLTEAYSKMKNFLSLSNPVDADSEELQEIIVDEFLFAKKPIAVFEEEGFVPWLNDEREKISWDFYDRYEKYLIHHKGWAWKTVSDIATSTDVILDHMANPKSDKYFNKRGLVIGDIQSGKTANYTGLINKAIDAGYKIVIVLAGLTRDLRNQTQARIDKEALGYVTKSNSEKGNAIGVGMVKQLAIEGLTYSDDKKDYGDFKKFSDNHTLDNTLTPLVAIVKKNVSVLKNVTKFLKGSQSMCYENGKLKIPVLIIDDEVDQASVDTKNADSIENASAINKAIRNILDSLNRYSYVGYTATPFANIFIDPDKDNDLYPKDFIVCLPTSDEYSGIKEYFGVDIKNDNEYDSDHTEDLFVNVQDYNEFFPKGIDKITAKTEVVGLPTSLKNAIRSFILVAAIKKQRGIFSHNSMLIHIARFKNPSNTLKPLVVDYLNYLYKKLKYEYDEEIEVYQKLWEEEFKETSINRMGDKFDDNWDKIVEHLLPSLNSAIMGVKVVNGDFNEQVDYSSTTGGEFVIIGGDKLSRGLTLEGLVISYYYRKSKMYDTLLQMGRWFGYRHGWIDLCRVYTTVQYMNDFIRAGIALEKFKADVDDMLVQKKNPREVGQKIMYSANLIPTSYSKMKTATKAKVSFSEEVQQVISFSKKHIKENFDFTNEFIKSLGEGEVRGSKVVFKNVDVSKVLYFLKKYKEAESYNGIISIRNWINYIENLNKVNELTSWTIVLSSLKENESKNFINLGGYPIYKPRRTLREEGDSSNLDTLLIKTNIDPSDFIEIFDPNSDNYKNVSHYDKTKEYPEFNEKTGLMSIYVTDIYEKEKDPNFIPILGTKNKVKYRRIEPAVAFNVVGPAIWFPKTKDIDRSAVVYYVNKDYLKYSESTVYDEEDEND